MSGQTIGEITSKTGTTKNSPVAYRCACCGSCSSDHNGNINHAFIPTYPHNKYNNISSLSWHASSRRCPHKGIPWEKEWSKLLPWDTDKNTSQPSSSINLPTSTQSTKKRTRTFQQRFVQTSGSQPLCQHLNKSLCPAAYASPFVTSSPYVTSAVSSTRQVLQRSWKEFCSKIETSGPFYATILAACRRINLLWRRSHLSCSVHLLFVRMQIQDSGMEWEHTAIYLSEVFSQILLVK